MATRPDSPVARVWPKKALYRAAVPVTPTPTAPLPRDPRVASTKVVAYKGAVIDVLVGPDATKYIVHRGVLVQSCWFRTALGSNYKEGQTGTINLPDDETTVFEVYLHWLYTHEISCRKDVTRKTRPSQTEGLFKAYIFGDKIGHFEFMDDLIRAIYYLCETLVDGKRVYPNAENTKLVYDKIAQKDSPLKRLLVDQVVAVGHGGFLDADAGAYHPEYLLDLSRAVLESRKPQEPDKREYRVDNLARYYMAAPPMAATTVAKDNEAGTNDATAAAAPAIVDL